MCGRFTLRTPLAVLAEQFQFDLEGATLLPLRYNIAPTQEVAAVKFVEGKRKLGFLRAAYKRRRCLVLADGYYEWLRVGKTKQPYLYEVDSGKPFALAGRLAKS